MTIRTFYYIPRTITTAAPATPITTPRWGTDPYSYKVFRDKNGSRVYYTIREKIGEGVFSTVHRLQPDRPGLKNKAIKVAKWSTFDKEIANLNLLGVNDIGVIKKPKFANGSMIVMSKYDTNLYERIPYLTPKMQKSAIDQLIKGVKVLHDKHLLHRDVTIHNVFCKLKRDDLSYHLGDFGFSVRNYGDKIHDIKGLGVVLRCILLKQRLIPTNNPLRPLTEADIPEGLPTWLAFLTNLTENNFRTINEVVNYYNEQTRLDKLNFFK